MKDVDQGTGEDLNPNVVPTGVSSVEEDAMRNPDRPVSLMELTKGTAPTTVTHKVTLCICYMYVTYE